MKQESRAFPLCFQHACLVLEGNEGLLAAASALPRRGLLVIPTCAQLAITSPSRQEARLLAALEQAQGLGIEYLIVRLEGEDGLY